MSRPTRKLPRSLCEAFETRDVPAAFPITASAAAISPDGGGIPSIKIVDPTTGEDLGHVQAYEDSFRGGVLVASGDTNGDGRDDILNGTGPGGGPVVRIVSGADGSVLSSLLADDPSFRGGVSVEARDLNGDGRDDVIAHLRHGNDDSLRVFNGDDSRFLSSVSRVVDDNPSPNDVLEGKAGGVTPGAVSHVEGTFVSADAAANAVTIRLASGSTVTVRAGAGTEVKRDKANATLASFQAGDRVEALIGSDGVAWEIEAKSAAFVEGRSGKGGSDNSGPGSGGSVAASVEGTITAIDTAANTVSIRTHAGTVTVVRAAAGTTIERNDRETTLAAFAVGDLGEAKIGANGIATKIEATTATTTSPSVPPPPSGTSNPPANSKLEGTITAVDAAAGTVTVRGQNGTSFLVRTTSATKVERNDSHTTLAAFQAGGFGEAEVGSNGFATKVEARQV